MVIGGCYMLFEGGRSHSFGAKSATKSSAKSTSIVYQFLYNEDGQGITEYGAILAFVSLLVALTFSAANGSLAPAISRCFKEVSSQLNNLSTAASSAS